MVWVHTCMCTGSKGEMAGGCAPIPTPEGGDSEMAREGKGGEGAGEGPGVGVHSAHLQQ